VVFRQGRGARQPKETRREHDGEGSLPFSDEAETFGQNKYVVIKIVEEASLVVHRRE
jgi:hypothetical protein